MKKVKIVYFLPVIILALIMLAVLISNALYLTDYTALVLNMAVMIVAAITMQKGKIWGAILAIVFYGGWSIWDYYAIYLPWLDSIPQDTVAVHSLVPVYYTAVPVMIYYFICMIIVKKESK